MTSVAFCSMLKPGTFFFKVTLKSNMFPSYMIVSRDDNKGHVNCCSDCIFGIENTELIVMYIQEEK